MNAATSHTGTSAPVRWRWPLGGVSLGRLGAGTLNAVLSFPLALAGFILAVVLGVLSIGLVPLYPVALLIMVLWIFVVRGLAIVDRHRVATLLDMKIPPLEPPHPTGGWHTRLWAVVRHRDTWRAMAYQLIRLPVAAVAFAAVVAAWAVPVYLLGLPLTLLGAEAERFTYLTVAGPTGAFFLGLAVLPLTALIVDAFATLDGALAASLLGPSSVDRLDRRVEQLRTTRKGLVDVAEQERRRIERDLHDGVGQQLVSLAMTLGMAREKLTTDPTGASDLIGEAHEESKQALADLRDTVRGITPAILADRGLAAALSSVAARAALPVSIQVDVAERPDEVTEGIAYYVACEGISNALRHAGATAISVSIAALGEQLLVEVTDDGSGGADPTRGTGLRGLHGRVAAVDGSFHVDSPAGGPTRVRALLPMRTHDAGSAQGDR